MPAPSGLSCRRGARRADRRPCAPRPLARKSARVVLRDDAFVEKKAGREHGVGTEGGGAVAEERPPDDARPCPAAGSLHRHAGAVLGAPLAAARRLPDGPDGRRGDRGDPGRRARHQARARCVPCRRRCRARHRRRYLPARSTLLRLWCRLPSLRPGARGRSSRRLYSRGFGRRSLSAPPRGPSSPGAPGP
jgi:hypothetical protein